MAAIIRSRRNGIPATDITGASRDDLLLGDVVSVTSVDAATTYSWILSFAPEGSAAVFSGSSSAVSPGNFTVDLEGPYLIRLTVDAGLPTEDTQYVRLRALTEFADLKLVSAGERRDGTGIIPVDIDTEGWANEQNFNLQALLGFVKRTALTGRILYVDANYGTDNYADHSTINDAITAAVGLGATVADPYAVLVRGGVYTEDVVFQSGVHVIGWPGGAARGNVVRVVAANGGGTGTHQVSLPNASDLVMLSNLDLINTGVGATDATVRKTGSGKVVFENCVIRQDAVGVAVGPALDIQAGEAEILGGELLVDDSNVNDRFTFAQTGTSTTVEIRDCLIQGPSGLDLNPNLNTLINCGLQRTIVRATGTAGVVGVRTSATSLLMEHCLVEALQPAVTALFQVHPSGGALISNVGVSLRWTRLDGNVTFDVTGIVGATSWHTGATTLGTVTYPGGPVSSVVATVDASSIFYDNTISTLIAENVQDAIDEIAASAAISPVVYHKNMPPVPNDTVRYRGWVPVAAELIFVRVYMQTVNTVGTYTLTVTNEATGNTVLVGATFDMNTVLAGTVTPVALTAVPADLLFPAQGRWTIELTSNNPGFNGDDIYLALVFNTATASGPVVEDLTTTLVVGNVTGGRDIVVSPSDRVIGVDAAVGSGNPGTNLILRGGLGDGGAPNGFVRVEGDQDVTGTLTGTVAYVPGVPLDWVGPLPADVQTALDRIASVVALMFGGPIP